jgi:hypothetical protein
MRVSFVNNDGGGFTGSVEVVEGTNYSKFFQNQMDGANSANYKIRVTRNGNRFTPEAGELVQEGDRVSITPSKITGYCG